MMKKWMLTVGREKENTCTSRGACPTLLPLVYPTWALPDCLFTVLVSLFAHLHGRFSVLQRLQAAVHYVVGRLTDAEGDAQEVTFSTAFVAALSRLTYTHFRTCQQHSGLDIKMRLPETYYDSLCYATSCRRYCGQGP